ncbi:hypothetical protein Tco_1536849, partial [Tanacetum coccineum]
MKKEVKVKENKRKGKEKKIKKVNVIIGSIFLASMSRMWRALCELLFGPLVPFSTSVELFSLRKLSTRRLLPIGKKLASEEAEASVEK